MENKIYTSPKILINAFTEDMIRTSPGDNELPPAFTDKNWNQG